MQPFGLLCAAAVAPTGRGEDGEVDAQTGEFFGFCLVCADDERLADEYDSQRVLLIGRCRVSEQPEFSNGLRVRPL